MSDEERLIELEHKAERYEEAVTQDAKEIAELKKNQAALIKEIERLNSAAIKIVQTLEQIPLWVDRQAVDSRMTPNLRAFGKFREFIIELKKQLFP